jgi:hypothetical protein
MAKIKNNRLIFSDEDERLRSVSVTMVHKLINSPMLEDHGDNDVFWYIHKDDIASVDELLF